MNIYEAIGVFVVMLSSAFGLALFLKFAYDGARAAQRRVRDNG